MPGPDQEPGSLPSLNIAPQPAELGKVAAKKHLAHSVISVTSCYSHPALQILHETLGSCTVPTMKPPETPTIQNSWMCVDSGLPHRVPYETQK